MKKNNSKRICMIAQASYPGDPRIRREAEAIERTGYEVDILCRPSGKQLRVERFGNITAYRVMHAPSQENLVKWMYYSSLFFIKSFWKLQFLYFKRKYNVIHVHNLPDFLVFVTTFQKLLGIPIILDLHDLSVELFKSKWQNKKSTVALFLIRMIEHFSCEFADHIITTSKGFAQRLVSRGISKEKITIIYNTPSSKHFYFNSKREYSTINNQATLLYHGTVSQRFGVDTVIKALPIIHQSIPGTKFIVFGKYAKNYKEELIGLAKELMVDKYVILNGIIPIEAVLNEINSSDFGMVPYINNEFMNLALSTKGFEYAASGLPIIASDLDPMRNIFNENCVTYVTPSNFGEIAAEVVYLCNHPNIREQKATNARMAMANITWDLMKKEYCQLINSLIHKNTK